MKRIIVGIVAACCLAFAGVASASVDTNLAVAIKRGLTNGAAKWVVIDGTHTASSGTFTGVFCSNTYVSKTSTTFLFQPIRFTIKSANYTNNGTVEHPTSVEFGAAC